MEMSGHSISVFFKLITSLKKKKQSQECCNSNKVSKDESGREYNRVEEVGDYNRYKF